MTDAWPGGVPFTPLRDSYGEKPERNVVSFQPEVGPPIERRRTSLASDLVDFTLNLSVAEYAALKAFYKDTLLDGVLPFTATDPLVGGTYTYKFREPPALRSARQLKVLVSISLRKAA